MEGQYSKKAREISGMTAEVRMIMPLIDTSLSMSEGFRLRITDVSERFNVRTCMLCAVWVWALGLAGGGGDGLGPGLFLKGLGVSRLLVDQVYDLRNIL